MCWTILFYLLVTDLLRAAELFFKLFVGETEDLISSLLKTQSTNVFQHILGESTDNKNLQNRLLKDNLRIERMTALECMCFRVLANLSYIEYRKVKSILESAGYNILHDASPISNLRSKLYEIIAQKLVFKVHEEQKGVSLDFLL